MLTVVVYYVVTGFTLHVCHSALGIE